MNDINAEREWMMQMWLQLRYLIATGDAVEQLIQHEAKASARILNFKVYKPYPLYDGSCLERGLHHKLAAEEQRRRLAIYQHDAEAMALVGGAA